MSNEIAQLLELQSIDQRLTEASERIKCLQRDRARLEEKVVEAKQAFDERTEDLKRLEHESLMKNLEVDELDANIRMYQHRLDTAIISFKEMEDLRAKIISEHKRIGQMEDDALQIMDAIAQEHTALEAAKGTLEERQTELAAAIADVDAQLDAVNQSIADLRAQRATLTEAMTEFLLSQYKVLHRKFSDPIAIISHATCSGCKLKLSGSTIERARGSLGLVACEHCSRILYIE